MFISVDRIDYFIVGVTNTSSAIQPPIRGSYPYCGQYPSTAVGGPLPVYCNVNTPPSRYVIIQQPANGPGYLNICELEMYCEHNEVGFLSVGGHRTPFIASYIIAYHCIAIPVLFCIDLHNNSLHCMALFCIVACVSRGCSIPSSPIDCDHGCQTNVNWCMFLFSIADFNIALGKPASQSSTYMWYSTPLNANLAVDGYVNTLCTNTNDGPGGPNWLMVDLGQIYSIGYVVLTNRLGDCRKTHLKLINKYVTIKSTVDGYYNIKRQFD